ncbi:MAG: aspartate kinase [Alphaproteobacteria bacterium]|nr:aspartate kinase [Alphaproteobacteria bacterium]
MAIIVQKFGGTSVADTARIQNVALRVKREVDAGHQVAVIVSAMSGITDKLVGYVRDVSDLTTPQQWADYDMVVSAGEQVTSGLLALALADIDIPAQSFAGWMLPMHTDNAYGKARIEEIGTESLHHCFSQGKVAVIAGFQGVSQDGRPSTLGRGGSDTSAVAIAAALGADRCDIYTDVDGVYTADPRIVHKARKLARISYEEMLELASQGSKVLQTRSVAMAMNHGVEVQVLSSFNDQPGTLLVDEEELVEKHKVTGIAYSRDEARITLTEVPNIPGVSAAIFGPLADGNINVDMIVQNVTEGGERTDITFTVPRADLPRALSALKAISSSIEYNTIHSDASVAKVSVIGVGMRSHAGVAQTMFKSLADKGINIIVISTSEIKVSVLIEEAYAELAVRTLHTAYGLDAE